jgi:hypothetical protein
VAPLQVTKFSWVVSLFVVLVLLLGFQLYGQPSQPTQLGMRGTSVFSAFLIFVAFILGMLGWGVFFTRFLKLGALGAVFSPAIGAGFFSVYFLSLGALGFPMARTLTILVICIGALGFQPAGTLKYLKSLLRWPRSISYRVIIGLIILQLFGIMALTFRIYPFWDPLWYHLVGPRLWFEAGKIYFPTHHLIGFNAGAWDQIYLAGAIFLGEKGGGGLAAGQLFAQWCHGIFAVAASSAAIFFFLRFFVRSRVLRGLGVLIALGIEILFFTTVLAKNDWGTILWGASGLSLLYLSSFPQYQEQRKRLAVVAGCLIGLSITTKWTMAFVVFALAIHAAYFFRRPSLDFPRWGAVFIGGLIGAFPILLRNALGTGNPFFPVLGALFSNSGLGPTWVEAMGGLEGRMLESGTVNFSVVPLLIWELLQMNSFNFFFFVCPILYFFSGGGRRKTAAWFSILTLFIAFAAFTGTMALPRWISLGVVIMSVLSLAFIHEALLRIPVKKIGVLSWRTLLELSLLFVLIIEGPFGIIWKGVAYASKVGSIEEQVMLIPPMRGMIWMRQNLKPSERIALLAETRVYYLIDLPVVRIWDDIELDTELSSAKTTEEIVQVLRENGFRYLLDSFETIDTYQRRGVQRQFVDSYSKIPELAVYSDEATRVIDLELWSERISSERKLLPSDIRQK